MYKRIILAAIFVFGLCTFLYFQFKPSTNAYLGTTSTPTSILKDEIKFNELSEYTQANNGTYVLILNDESSDYDYLVNSILVPLSMEYETSPLPAFVSVKMNEATDMSVTRLKNIVGVESYPSLVSINVADGQYTVEGTLKITSDKPVTVEAVRTWLFENGLWNGPFKETAN